MGLLRSGLITFVNNRMCVWIICGGCNPCQFISDFEMSDIMDYFWAGEDQEQTNQPNNQAGNYT